MIGKITAHVVVLCLYCVFQTVVAVIPRENSYYTLQCSKLFIQRDYPGSGIDGIYVLTNESCADVPYYKKLDDVQPRYFYRQERRTWLIYFVPCKLTNYGETDNVDYPWQSNFVGVDTSKTEITCLDFKQRDHHLIREESGSWSLPDISQKQPSLIYSLKRQLPMNTKNMTIRFESGNVYLDDMSILFHIVMRNYTLAVNDIGATNFSQFNIAFPNEMNDKTLFLRFVANDLEKYGNKPWINMSYDISYWDLLTDETTITAAPDTTTHSIVTSTNDSVIYDNNFVFEDYDGSGYYDDSENQYFTSRKPEQEEPEESLEDDCIGKVCNAGLPCKDGVCPCPTAQQCTDNEAYHPVCVSNGKTYDSRCHVRADNCGLGLDVIHDGQCREKPSTSAPVVEITGKLLTSTLLAAITTRTPSAQAIIATPGVQLMSVIGSVMIFVLLVVIAIVSILCVKRNRDKRRGLEMWKTDPDHNEPIMQTKRDIVNPVASRPVSHVTRNSRPFSRSSQSSFRASPKSQHKSMSIQPEGLDPDRFSLSGCITPLHDMLENPFTTFANSGVDANGTPLDKRPLSMTDNGVNEVKIDTDSGIQVCMEPGQDETSKPTEVQNRVKPPKRHMSQTESKVYEIETASGEVLDVDTFLELDSVFDDSHIATRL